MTAPSYREFFAAAPAARNGFRIHFRSGWRAKLICPPFLTCPPGWAIRQRRCLRGSGEDAFTRTMASVSILRSGLFTVCRCEYWFSRPTPKPSTALRAWVYSRTRDAVTHERLAGRPSIAIPAIRSAMSRNGSPPPKFSTDEGRTYFFVELPVHPQMKSKPTGHQVAPQVTAQFRSVVKAAAKPCAREKLQSASGIKDLEHFRKQYLLPLLAAGLIEMTIPDKPRSSDQQ